jgi:predicted nucleotidyltransferase
MDTPTRMKLAREIAARMAVRHGEALCVGGVYGSTARGEASAWSDLNLLFVHRVGSVLASRRLLVQGLVVELRMVAEDQLEAELSGPGSAWPFWMGLLETFQPLVGTPELPAHWRALGTSLEREPFLIGAATHLPGLVFSPYGRLRACGARRNRDDAPLIAQTLVFELLYALCLLNRRWLTRSYSASLAQSFTFPLLPEGYAQLAPRLLSAQDLDSLVTDAGTLVAAYWRLLAREMMAVPNYQQVDQLPLP